MRRIIRRNKQNNVPKPDTDAALGHRNNGGGERHPCLFFRICRHPLGFLFNTGYWGFAPGFWPVVCWFLKLMSGPVRQLKYILVVDDEPFVAESVQFLLEEAGYIVEKASSGQEALGIFAPGKFDMVFTDYLMPEMRGDKLAAAIKTLCPTQPVVMITAFPEKLQTSACPLGGVDSFICKPFDAQILRTALARYTHK
jgi:CheY-like chemotaxis protein